MKKPWNDYVRELMIKQNINQNDIADAMDKTQGAIGHWLTGRRTPNFDDVAKILKIVGADKVILNPDGTVEDFDSNVSLAKINKSFSYPLISPIQAGMWTGIDFLRTVDEDFEMIQSNVRASEHAFYLRIEGESMEPRFHEGDLVLIDPTIAPTPGKFVAATNGNNEATFKRYKQLAQTDEYGNPHFLLTPLNDSFPTLSSLEQPIKIIGVAIERREML